MDDLTRDLLAARDGDAVAFAAWVERTQAEVWRLCAHLAGRDDADDVAQDVYVRAWRALPSYRGDASARTWLLAIARRACADALRRRVRARRREGVAPAPGPVPDASDRMAVDALLDVLDVDQRAAFVLTQLHGLAYDEAAAVCGVAVGTIRSRVARARAVLVSRWRAAEAM